MLTGDSIHYDLISQREFGRRYGRNTVLLINAANITLPTPTLKMVINSAGLINDTRNPSTTFTDSTGAPSIGICDVQLPPFSCHMDTRSNTNVPLTQNYTKVGVFLVTASGGTVNQFIDSNVNPGTAGAHLLYYNSGNPPQVKLYHQGFTGTAPAPFLIDTRTLSTAFWTHYVATWNYDGTTALYFNGVMVQNGIRIDSTWTNAVATPMVIGSVGPSGINTPVAKFHSVRLYNVSFTPEQVVAILQQAVIGN